MVKSSGGKELGFCYFQIVLSIFSDNSSVMIGTNKRIWNMILSWIKNYLHSFMLYVYRIYSLLFHYFSSIIYFILSFLIFLSRGSLHSLSPPFYFILFFSSDWNFQSWKFQKREMNGKPSGWIRRLSTMECCLRTCSGIAVEGRKGFAPQPGPRFERVHGAASGRGHAPLYRFISPSIALRTPTASSLLWHQGKCSPPPMKYFFLEFIRKSFDLKLENQRIWSLKQSMYGSDHNPELVDNSCASLYDIKLFRTITKHRNRKQTLA